MVEHRYWQMVTWHGAAGDTPILVFAEIVNGWEVRKVDVFDDGRLARADARDADGSTVLGSAAVLPITAIDDMPDFSAVEIAREAFEALWLAVPED